MAIPDTYEICVDWNGDGDFDDAYEDITTDIKALNWQRGKDKQLGSTQAAILNLVIKPGSATKYSPENTGGVLYGNLLPYKVVRVRVKIGATWYTQFYGYIKKIVPHPHWGKDDAYIYCVDGMEQLARAITNVGFYDLIAPLRPFTGACDTGSGYIWRAVQATWADAHDALFGEGVVALSSGGSLSAEFSLGAYNLERVFLSYDTSPIGANDIITGVKLRIWIESKYEADTGSAAIHIVEGVQNDQLLVGDFGDLLAKTVSGGRISYDYIVEKAFNEIVFNSTGIEWINKGGNTMLGLRMKGDIDNISPSAGLQQISIDISAGANDVYSELLINYTKVES